MSVKLEHLQAYPLIYPLQVLRVVGQTVSVVNLVRIRKMKLTKWDTQEIIFEAECDSWKELVEGALKEGVSLRGVNLENADLENADLENANLKNANLENANLINANLRGVDLRGADLINANLRGANLINADLRGVDLRGANLRDADLRGVDLRGVYLRGACLRGVDLKYLIADMNIFHSMQLDTYHIVFDKEILAIGCQQHTIAQWKNFTDDEISEMDDDNDALIWWKKWKTFIFEAIRLSLEGK